jgi:hypothetical protein
MAGIGLPVVFVGDGLPHARVDGEGTEFAELGVQYNGIVAGSPSAGSSVADVQISIGGAQVLITSVPQSMAGLPRTVLAYRQPLTRTGL